MYTDGCWFKEDDGRTLILRGANLGGSSKVPYSPDGATYRKDYFYRHRDVSFIGRPFPLAEAEEHFSRLREWGMTFLRFLVTWEAVEHAGPGQYDEAYLDYLFEILRKAGDYGIHVFIDPHQDVWSRWTGGDGAPGWTLEALGMDLSRLAATGAAVSHQEYGDPFPRMIWPTNYNKLGAATLFTLFLGGDDFAPGTKIDGMSAQKYLQDHYINAFKRVAMRLKDLPYVVGYDTMNEPGAGYIGVPDLKTHAGMPLRMGPSPTSFQSMLLGAGYPQEVGVYELDEQGFKTAPAITQNPEGVSLWREGYDCVWKQNGVWTDKSGEPQLLRPDHFSRIKNRPVDFPNDYLKPFALRFIKAIREIVPEAILFLEGGLPASSHFQWGDRDPENVVNAAHWYDGMTLMTKRFDPQINLDFSSMETARGEVEVRESFVRQLARIRQISSEDMGGIPTLIGEFGLPFDLDNKAAYANDDFRLHTMALDAYYNAMDANLLGCTIWNYTADNTNERGDMWNDEDLSIFSRDQQDHPGDVHSGGRGLDAIVRPYARKIAGEPISMRYDAASRVFEFEFRYDSRINAPTEIFVPDYAYTNGYRVELSEGGYEANRPSRTVTVKGGRDLEVHRVAIRPEDAPGRS